jgi:hypothetical protein
MGAGVANPVASTIPRASRHLGQTVLTACWAGIKKAASALAGAATVLRLSFAGRQEGSRSQDCDHERQSKKQM